jgi:hypothetical protein
MNEVYTLLQSWNEQVRTTKYFDLSILSTAQCDYQNCCGYKNTKWREIIVPQIQIRKCPNAILCNVIWAGDITKCVNYHLKT